MKKITLLSLMLYGGSLFAQIVNTAPYILTIEELKSWTPDGATASDELISTVPLAQRFINTATQFNPELNNNLQIAYLPDGMNNFGNYYGEQSRFNLYNFTHWAYIDKLIWFGGTSTQTVQVPSSPWANAAHKNGVKVYGNIFFSPVVYGGSTNTLMNFMERDENGRFVVIPKLVAIMDYYRFDGWFINQETATTAGTALLMKDFLRDLTAEVEARGKQVMWYDAMIQNGAVGWQNRLNATNSPFVQDNQDNDSSNGFETRVSSSIFINFFWAGSSFPSASRTRARTIGRSEFDVFTGADIWPTRSNGQGNFINTGNTFMAAIHESATTAYTSLGLFATNCLYNYSGYTNFNNDPYDVDSFYSIENHLFAGLDRNPALIDATGFKGISNWVPEASVITRMPFETNFSTGHGTKKFALGVQTSDAAWHNMNSQDILPTWNWAFSQNGALSAKWDFDDAYNSGNSLQVSGNLQANTAIDLMLYKTKLTVVPGTSVDIALRYGKNMKLLLVFSDNPTQRVEFSMADVVGNDWQKQTITGLGGYNGKEIAAVGLRFYSQAAINNYAVNIGLLKVYQNPDLSTAEDMISHDLVTVSYPKAKQVELTFNKQVSEIKYGVYDLQGKLVRESSIPANTAKYIVETNGISSGVYILKLATGDNSELHKIVVK